MANSAVAITTANGMLKGATNAPSSRATPPRSSSRAVTHAVGPGAGIPSAVRMAAKCSGPRASFAYPCAAKPNPTAMRNGSSAQAVVGRVFNAPEVCIAAGEGAQPAVFELTDAPLVHEGRALSG